MMNHLSALTLVVGLAAQPVFAQTTGTSTRDGTRVLGGAAMATLWDDETFLGRGVLLSGGVARPLGGHAVIEGELAWATHHRDSGYLEADGTPIIGTARLMYAFRSPTARTRPFASVGAVVVHSTGHFTSHPVTLGPGGFPVELPPVRADWSITKPGLEWGGGVSIGSGNRVSFRPEIRWTYTAAEPTLPSTLEPPIWVIRMGLTVGWRVS